MKIGGVHVGTYLGGPPVVTPTRDVEVEIAFVARLRGMIRFQGEDAVSALVAQMADDVRRTRELLR